jgi:membrane-associated phospholipid phosphatase
MKNIKFLASPALILSYLVSFVTCIFSIIILPIQPVWINYYKLFFIISLFLILAVALHPIILKKFLSVDRIQHIHGLDKIWEWCIIIAYFMSISLIIQTYVQIVYVISAHIPLTDDVLHSWDVALGLDWLWYLKWVYMHPLVMQALYIAYASMTFVTPVALLLLLIMQRNDCVFVFLHTFVISALIVVTIGGFFPAHGAATYLFPDMAKFELYSNYPGNYGISIIDALRNTASPVIFDPERMNGVVTFPSFHTAGTIAICYAFNRSKLKVLAWVYAALVIASTPVMGAHYFIDVLVGAVIGFSVCLWTDHYMRRRWAVYFPDAPFITTAQAQPDRGGGGRRQRF